MDVAGVYENLPNFWIWEIGKALDFVMEVASPSTVANDLSWERELYPQLGIQEHWRFDPTDGQLSGKPITGDRLVNGQYEEYPAECGADGSMRSLSELLSVVFYWNGGEFDALDPATGMTIDKRVAGEARADTAEARAIFAQAELNIERARASAAEDKLARLKEQLRGQEP